jgi:acetolactate synthase I/II/III large subunit
MSVADAIVKELAKAGVHHLFGMPGGGSNLDLIEAAERAGIRFVLAQTETAGAIMGIACAELTGTPGVCLATLGPGAASLVNGVACASLERAPLVAFTDAHPAAASGFSHQRLDHHAIFRPLTKWTARVDAVSVEATLQCAIAAAMEDPHGPVHLDLAPDVSGAALPQAREGVARASGHIAMPAPSRAIAHAVRASRRPLLIVGLGARREEDVRAVRALCARGIPALVTYKAKGVVSDADPAFAGVFTNASLEQPILSEADLIVGVGLDPVELIPQPWKARAPVVYCGRAQVSTSQIPYAAGWIGGAAAIADVIPAKTEWDLDAVRRAVDAARARVRVRSRGLSPSSIVEIVSSSARDARVTVDAGAHMFPATLLWSVAHAKDFLISNGLSTMGFALPAAIGAATCDPGRRTVALTGDGGLLMCVAELATAVRERLNIVTVVFDDERLSLIDVKQRQRGYRESGVAMGRVDWGALARGFGMPAFAADSEASLQRACREALVTEGPSLIAARTDPSAYEAILTAVRGQR